jgi:hypothetical protein
VLSVPFPGDLHLVTVSGTILHPDATPATGTVVFQMPFPLKDTTGHVVVGNTPPVIATLVNGAFSVSLPATDQAQINPINWAYLITVATDAAQYVFQAQLPTSPSSTTLDALIPLVTPPTPGVYVPLTYIAAANGVASLDSGGHVPLAQLPSGSGVLTVTATDSTITVGGTPQNPTVGVNAIAESRVTNLVSDLAAKASSSRQILAGAGLSGGGDLSADRTLSATDATTGAKGIVQLAGDLAGTAASPTVPALASKAPASRLITAGTGLTGGGDLSADRTLAVSYGTGSGTAAQGNDGRITGAVQASTATTKGDLLVATAAASIARLGVGQDLQVLTADSSQAGGLKWAAASGGGPVFPLSGYGLLVAADDPALFQNASGLTSGTVFGARCWVPANTALSNLAAAVRTGGTYSSSAVPNRLGIYDDTGTLLQATTDDSTLWTTAGWAARSITTVAAQATGRFVYILYILGGFTGVSAPYALGANDSNAPWLGLAVTNSGNRRAFYLNGQSALPASFTPSSVGTNTGYIPLVGAY